MGIETKRIMKKYLYLVLGFYFLLHVAKIEVFPLYHFGMYSQYVPYKESPFYPNLETDMLAWLSRYFKCRNSQNVIIEKSTYRFGKNQEIKLQNKQIILPQ